MRPSLAKPAFDGPQICEGLVTHSRLQPVGHRFAYPVAFVLLPLHQLDECRRAFFAVNRWSLLAFHARDHGPRDGSALMPWFAELYRRQLAKAAAGRPPMPAAGRPSMPAAAGRPSMPAASEPFAAVWIQTFPRVLGYVFNPVSFWYGYRADGSLTAILAEVSNTFGERHNYLLMHGDGRPIRDGECFTRDKVFHVSPFFPVRGQYRFQFHLEGDRPRVRIDYSDAGGLLLRTALSGVPAPLTGRRALLTFLRYPLLTLGVVARIHWQAARLYFGKRVSFFRKPLPPIEETTS